MKRLVLLFTAVMLSAPVFAGLMDSVAIVRMEYPEGTIDQFADVIETYDDTALDALAEGLRQFDGGGHGSGFCIQIPNDDENLYLITNRHVVSLASTVDVEFQRRDGSDSIVLEDCPVIGVLDDEDLALVRLEGLEDSAIRPLEWDGALVTDGTEVWTAGFPGLINGNPEWQLAKGNVSNEQSRALKEVAPGLDYVIQHSAPIDGGNSGGPLLVKEGDAFRAVGVNTWSARSRENTNFAVPGAVIGEMTQELLSKQRESRDALRERCDLFADELGKEEANVWSLSRFISHEAVLETGWDAAYAFRRTLSREGRRDFDADFYADAFDTMQYSLMRLILPEELEELEGDVELISCQFSAENENQATSVIRLLEEEMEFTWAVEQGNWRIVEMPETDALMEAVKNRKKAAGDDEDKSDWTGWAYGASIMYRQPLFGNYKVANSVGAEGYMNVYTPGPVVVTLALGAAIPFRGGDSFSTSSVFTASGCWLDLCVRYEPIVKQTEKMSFFAPYVGLGGGVEMAVGDGGSLMAYPMLSGGMEMLFGKGRGGVLLTIDLTAKYSITTNLLDSSMGSDVERLDLRYLSLEPSIGLAF
ncbi:MAG: serine protease [Spirochaetales bacterium]|nr:serine protease [Spirochaetales bacterium]